VSPTSTGSSCSQTNKESVVFGAAKLGSIFCILLENIKENKKQKMGSYSPGT
jgi:hypothetical protein